MPRRPLFVTHQFPYHVTARSNNKEWFYLPLPICWRIFCSVLSANSAKYGTFVHAFVLMSNHFHLILTTPKVDLGETMRHILTEVSKKIQRKAKRINHVFGARYKWSVLDNPYSVGYVQKYVLRNPVRAGICSYVQQYPFSSITKNFPRAYPPLMESIESIWKYVPRNLEARLKWLNTPAPKELEVLISRGLKKQNFSFSKGNDSRIQISKLASLYQVGDPEMRDRYLFGREGD